MHVYTVPPLAVRTGRSMGESPRAGVCEWSVCSRTPSLAYLSRVAANFTRLKFKVYINGLGPFLGGGVWRQPLTLLKAVYIADTCFFMRLEQYLTVLPAVHPPLNRAPKGSPPTPRGSWRRMA